MDFQQLLQDRALADLSAIIAERSRNVVAWIGAGLSSPYGYPSWGALRSSLQSTAVQKANSFGDEDKERTLLQLNNVAGIEDPWTAFGRLYEVLGQESFRAEIRHALDPEKKKKARHYEVLLRIPWRGILSLNLDDLCQQEIQRSSRRWYRFEGVQAHRMAHLLNSPHPYFVALHGTLESYDSWILKKTDMRALLKHEGYRTFIKAILLTSTVVFMGITANDVTSGGFLEEISDLQLTTGSHFWITDRSDVESDRWAERNGIRIVRYDASNNHEQFFKLLQHLASYESLEEIVEAEAQPQTPVSLPPPEQLIAQTPDLIRQELSKYARAHADDADQLREFYKQYRRCIHQAWLVETQAPDNGFFGFTLERPLGLGAFGRVYSARKNDTDYAVKILHQDVHDKDDMVQSFRRGVRSIRFLTEENLPGVVRYVEAYEIPASLIMEYVPGLTLLEAVEAGYVRNWSTRIKVAQQLATIIRLAHESQRRVLHRDIRPHNVIIKNFFSADDEVDVVVLDFDLSWHRDSTERSVYPNIEGALGYGAPEQFDAGKPGRTRTTLVDSFGLGMTLFFMGIGRHPKPREQDHGNWDKTLRDELAIQSCDEWHCVPNRYVRLVHGLTCSQQSMRVDFQSAKSELDRLHAMFRQAKPMASFLAEELMARAVDSSGYSWDEDKDCATAQISGGSVSATGNDKDEDIELEFHWMDPGDRQRATIRQNLDAAKTFLERRLSEIGWHVRVSVDNTVLRAHAQISVSALHRVLDASAKAIQQARGKFSF